MSAPIIFVLILNQSNVGNTSVNSVSLSSTQRFVEVGEPLDFAIDVKSLIPVNAVGATLTYPPELVAVETAETVGSIIDLWVEEPTYDNVHGSAKLSGGITDQKGFVGQGHIATYRFAPHAPGKAMIVVEDAVLLARDGKGTNVLETKGNITFIIREKGAPTPDLDNDGMLSFSDAAICYLATLRPYEKRFDFNGDGKVSFADVIALGAFVAE